MKKFIHLIFCGLVFLSVNPVDAFGQRRVTTPSELRGSVAQRIEQNMRAESLGVSQIANDETLARLVREKVLSELTDGDNYFIDRGVKTKPWKITRRIQGKRVTINCEPKPNRVFVYPWVKEYMDKLAADYFSEFKKKFKITSGVRSLEEHALMRMRGSCYYEPAAAQASNLLEETLHARAIAIDISRRGMKASEVKWMRERLIADKINGIEFEIDPIEESICYHIVVFPKNPDTSRQ